MKPRSGCLLNWPAPDACNGSIRRGKADPRRIHFYLHPKTSWEALRAWHEAGYPLDRADDDVGSWKRLHKLFGLALNNRIVEDWNKSARRRPPA